MQLRALGAAHAAALSALVAREVAAAAAVAAGPHSPAALPFSAAALLASLPHIASCHENTIMSLEVAFETGIVPPLQVGGACACAMLQHHRHLGRLCSGSH